LISGSDDVVVRRGSRRAAREWSLVLQATGIAHELAGSNRSWLIIVAELDLVRAREQLDAFEIENENWPPTDDEPGPLLGGALSCVVYGAALSLVHHWQNDGAFGVPGFQWTAAGSLQAGRVLDGEWWRTVTALTLHLDPPHLIGNLIFGVLFAALACQLVGTGLAWCSILLAGSLGNALDAWVHSPEHTALGASTAVFAALGIVVAYRWQRRAHLRHGRLQRMAPLAAGAFLLGWLGQSGDVVAHVAGFGFGVMTGALLGLWRIRGLPGTAVQRLLSVVPLGVIALCWYLAMQAGA
jgi:membrane associated rhomboid family serine protease